MLMMYDVKKEKRATDTVLVFTSRKAKKETEDERSLAVRREKRGMSRMSMTDGAGKSNYKVRAQRINSLRLA